MKWVPTMTDHYRIMLALTHYPLQAAVSAHVLPQACNCALIPRGRQQCHRCLEEHSTNSRFDWRCCMLLGTAGHVPLGCRAWLCTEQVIDGSAHCLSPQILLYERPWWSSCWSATAQTQAAQYICTKMYSISQNNHNNFKTSWNLLQWAHCRFCVWVFHISICCCNLTYPRWLKFLWYGSWIRVMFCVAMNFNTQVLPEQIYQ